MDDLALQFDIDPTNWVKETPAVAGKAVTFVTDLCQQAREDRQQLEDGWIEGYNQWDCYPQIRYYEGRANLYIPASNRVLERGVGKIHSRLFPSGDDFFDVKPLPPGEESEHESVREDLDAAKALMSHNLHDAIKIRRKMILWLRQLLVVGTSPWATDYITAEDLRGRGQRRQFTLGRRSKENGGGTERQVRTRSRIGPTGRPVDVFTWYVWPPTVDELTEAVIVFEDQLVTKATMEEWRALGRYEFTDEDLRANEGKVPDHSIWRMSDRLKRRGGSSDDTAGGLYVVTTAYADWNRRGEEKEEKVACQFALLNDSVCLMARQNPWWDQEPPYDWLRTGRYVDEAYGRGLIYWVRELQYALNDMANLTLDTMTYSMMPPAAVDPGLVPDPTLLLWRPGAFWPVPPNAIKWHVIPDTHKQGFDFIRQTYEMIQESSGAATGGQYLPTLGIARGAETATGQQLLMASADVDIKLITDAIEEEGLEPLLHRLDSREQQFLPMHSERILRALGPKAMPLLREGMRIRREQMAGTRTYTWTGSHISEQREAIQKAGPQLFEIAAKIGQTPEGRIEILGMFQDLYRSFGFSNADARIKIRKPGLGFDPQLEHMVMRAGHDVAPIPGEPHMEHLGAHDQMLPQAEAEGWADRLKRHILETILMLREDAALAGEAPGMPGLRPQMAPGGNGAGAQPIFARGGAR